MSVYYCWLYFSDIRKLARDFKNVPVEDIIVNCIELGVQANSVLPVTCRWSMANLVEYCVSWWLFSRIEKNWNFILVENVD